MPDTTARGIQYPLDADAWAYQDQQQDMAETADTAVADLAAAVTPLLWRRSGTNPDSTPSDSTWRAVQATTQDVQEASGILQVDGAFPSGHAIVAQVDVLLRYECTVSWDTNATGRRDIRVGIYDSSDVFSRELSRRNQAGTSGAATWQGTEATFLLSAGEKVVTDVRQNSGVSLDILTHLQGATVLRVDS